MARWSCAERCSGRTWPVTFLYFCRCRTAGSLRPTLGSFRRRARLAVPPPARPARNEAWPAAAPARLDGPARGTLPYGLRVLALDLHVIELLQTLRPMLTIISPKMT